MRKSLIFVITLLFISLLSSHAFAEEDTEETNELGVKVGTEVFGEDISELSEEELQYVPKGWRDGYVESTHDTGEDTQSFSLQRASYPDVNAYIKKKNFKAKKVKYDHNPDFEKFNYRNGHGAVEGVVAHETANDSSNIHQEISYMSRNHRNAFVHAFVDHSNIIEIHPNDLGAWGAGRYANQRFVHVELVRVNTFDQFARSINNYSDYLASVLYDYKSGVTSAEKSGKGTLWSHNAVSKHLGGTNHVDPHGYFAKWGYRWNDFVKLVEKKYKEKIKNKRANTSKLGRIKTSDKHIYPDPANLKKYSKAGSKHTNEVFYIKAEAKLKGKTYYLISRQPSSKKGTVGWVQGNDMNVHSHKGIDKKNKTFKIHGTGKAYDKAWGGSKNLVYNLSEHAGKTFKVNLTETVGNNEWFRGILDGKQVWIHYSYLIRDSSTSKLGHIRSTDTKIYTTLEQNSDFVKAGNESTNAVYYIKKKAEVRRQTYYLISTKPSSLDGMVGWIKAEDMSTHRHVGVDKKNKTLYIEGIGTAYSKAWGGSKDAVYEDMSKYQYLPLKVNLTEKVGNNTWYRGKLNGKTVWLHSSYLIKDKKESKTSKLGHLRSSATIYKTIGDESTSISAAKVDYLNAVYYIKKQTKIGKQTFYLISTQPSSTKGTIGWVKSQDMSTHSHTGVDKKNKTYYIKGTGTAYGTAWGGSKDAVYEDMSKYQCQPFEVHLTEKVGNNTWYRGKLDGKTVWLHSSYVLTTKEENKTSRLGHLRSQATIYETIGDGSSAFSAKDYLNKSYYIKKQAKIGSQIFYLISTEPSSTKGTIGWVKSQDTLTHSHTGIDKKKKTYYIKGTGTAYGTAWGGSKDVVFEDMSHHKYQPFKVHLTEKVGNNTWYRGNLDGTTVWLHSSYVLTTKEENKISRLGHLKTKAIIYKTIGNQSSSFSAGKEDYLNAVYYIKKQIKIDGQTFYLISNQPSSTKGTIGWVNARDMSTHAHVGVDKKSKEFTIKGTGNAYSKAWGGKKDFVYDMDKYRNQKFNVHLTEKVGKNIWHRGNLDGKTVWLHSSYIK